jgi:hypothetical protein
LDNDKKSARVQLDALMQTTLQQYQGSINDLLLAFGAEYSIENFHPTYQGGGQPRSDYGLRVRNQPVRLGSRTDLATGHSFATTLIKASVSLPISPVSVASCSFFRTMLISFANLLSE